MITKKKEGRKFLIFTLLSLLLVSIFAIAFASAADCTMSDKQSCLDVDGCAWTDAGGCIPSSDIATTAKTPDKTKEILDNMYASDSTGCGWILPNGVSNPKVGDYFFYDRCVLWIGGAKINELNQNQASVIGNFVKWFVLILVILLIYSVLAQMQFPENSEGEFSTFLGILISVVVGILSTFFITTQELITAMMGYTALGITLTVFFPILILGFFTITTARVASPIGIYFQRIMWIIYSVYLFIKSGMLFAISRGWGAANGIGGWAGHTDWYDLWGMQIKITEEAFKNYDVAMITTLFIVSIAVFIIMGMNGQIITRWLMKEAAESDIATYKMNEKLQDAKRKADAESMKKG